MKHASMNRIYRLVWNTALGVWVAVTENAKGAGKGRSARKSVLAAAAALFFMSPASQAADASNATILNGAASGTVATVGQVTTVSQATARMVIDWSSLSTVAGETLKFNQPGVTRPRWA